MKINKLLFWFLVLILPCCSFGGQLFPNEIISKHKKTQTNLPTPLVTLVSIETKEFCNYEICLTDDYGDGWNDGFVDLYINDTLYYEGLTISDGFGPECYPIPVNSGDIISTVYTAGDWPYENAYYVRNFSGDTIAYIGAEGTAPGDIAGITAICECCYHYVVLSDDNGDGWNGNSIDIYINDVLILEEITLSDGYGPDTTNFEACTNDDIDIYYNNTGNNGFENEYSVYDAFDTLLSSTGNGGTTPVDLTDLTANCIPYICFDPGNQSVDNITPTSANLTWTENGIATLWDIEYDISGFSPTGTPSGDYDNVESNIELPLTGLIVGTLYDWYVRADCAGDNIDASNWVGPHSFTTLIENDLCEDAISVFCGNAITGSTVGATIDIAEDCGTTITGPGVWYHLTGANDILQIDLCSDITNYDTKLSVYKGSCDALICVDGNDDQCGLQSGVAWYGVSGNDYYILVHGYSDITGTFELTINCEPPGSTTWIGEDNVYTDWFNAENWDNGVPGNITNTTIPEGLINYPTIDRTAVCNDIYLGSNAASTATLLDGEFLTVYGTASVDRYFSGNDFDWHFISSPISDATANVFLDMYLSRFNEETNDYVAIVDPSTPLNVMEGYAVYSTSNVNNTVTFIGTLNFGNKTKEYSASYAGWNLMGNPFVSSIDWEKVAIPAGMNTEIHFLEAATGAYLPYVKGVGGYSQYIPPMQGFFIKAGSAGSLTIADSTRTHFGSDIFYKNDNPNLLILEAANSNFSDLTWIHYNQNADIEHDGTYDAYKLYSSTNAELPVLFTITPSGDWLSINGIPEVTSVSVGFTAAQSGLFTISLIDTGDFTDIILEDLFNGSLTELSDTSYTFNYSEGDDVDRFLLHLTPITGMEETLTRNNIFSYEKDIIVRVPENTRGNIVIYDIIGREVASLTLNGSINKIQVKRTGYYIVKVQSLNNVVTKKVFIN